MCHFNLLFFSSLCFPLSLSSAVILPSSLYLLLLPIFSVLLFLPLLCSFYPSSALSTPPLLFLPLLCSFYASSALSTPPLVFLPLLCSFFSLIRSLCLTICKSVVSKILYEVFSIFENLRKIETVVTSNDA